jgi:hypothetical protein
MTPHAPRCPDCQSTAVTLTWAPDSDVPRFHLRCSSCGARGPESLDPRTARLQWQAPAGDTDPGLTALGLPGAVVTVTLGANRFAWSVGGVPIVTLTLTPEDDE